MNKAQELYSGKKVLIFGLGLNQGGVGSAKFFAKAGAEVRVTDLKSEEDLKPSLEQLQEYDIKYTLGEHKEEDIEWADLIIKNPGVKSGNKYIYLAEKLGKQVDMDMGIFFSLVNPNQIIGVTGTKGKSTTSSLIYQAIKESGTQVIFAGNIGKSVLDTIEYVDRDTLVVLEMSSFQLEGLESHKTSPKYAVITNIHPDHLNYYDSMHAYIEAKRIIAKFQREQDFLFLNQFDQTLNDPKFIEGLKAKITFFSPLNLPHDFQPTLKGEHNLQNYAAALAVTKQLGIDSAQALQAMNKFTGVEFRMQLIKEWHAVSQATSKPVKIYNDTAATSPSATEANLKAYPNSIAIVGGMNKNLPYEELAKVLDESPKAIYFLEGEATEEIRKNMTNLDKIKGTFNNFDDLLNALKLTLEEGDTVILSPGAASFNLFQNEFDRGRKFNAAVEKIFA